MLSCHESHHCMPVRCAHHPPPSPPFPLDTQVVPVRPYKHDEYERFLLPAYPYYASVLSTMAAFFLAGLVFLYSK